MSATARPTRPFSVTARHLDPHHARVVEASSFEAAAVAFLEDLHAPAGPEDLRVVVREIETGHEHSFRVDLGSAAGDGRT